GGAGLILVGVVLAVVAIAALFSTGLAVAFTLIGAVLVFWTARKPPDLDPRWTALGALWVALPCVCLLWLAREEAIGRVTLLWVLAVVWTTDVGAYAVGRMLGGPRLAPRWSPGKTWAGLAGGVVCAALAGWAPTGRVASRSSVRPDRSDRTRSICCCATRTALRSKRSPRIETPHVWPSKRALCVRTSP